MKLVVFSHLRWDFVLQRPQHLLRRFASHYEVLMVEEPVPTDADAHLEIQHPMPGIQVLTPHLPNGDRGFSDDQFGILRTLLAAYFKEHEVVDYVAWFYTPMALPLLDRLSPLAVVYDCMDELAAFKNAPALLHEREAALIGLADVVFTGGPSLYEAKRRLHPKVLCLPSAVDAHHFARSRALADAEMMARADALQDHIDGPRFGFFGVIDERFDVELLDQLSAARPDWQFVMVGPVVKISPADLPQRANIHWLGQQPYALLPQLVAGWDVCLLPFALNESTRFISPTKTLEYMAADRPIVSTPVRDVSVLYGEHVSIAHGAQGFAQACAKALEEDAAEIADRSRRRHETVARYSWDNTADTMRAAIGEAIESKQRVAKAA